jgi:ferric-dicitrate binding protein FerR (iron transport regulator)
VKADNHAAILQPGLKAGFSKITGSLEVLPFHFDQELGWKEDKIVFQATDFSAFVRELERWYGVEVQVQGIPEAEWQITGIFENLSLELLMESVKYSKEINYSIENKSLNIYF